MAKRQIPTQIQHSDGYTWYSFNLYRGPPLELIMNVFYISYLHTYSPQG